MCPYILGAGEAQRHRQRKRESVRGWGLRWTKAGRDQNGAAGDAASRGLCRRSRWQGAGPNPPPSATGCHGAGQQPVFRCPQEAKGERGPVRGPQPSLCSSQSLTRQRPGTLSCGKASPGIGSVTWSPAGRSLHPCPRGPRALGT